MLKFFAELGAFFVDLFTDGYLFRATLKDFLASILSYLIELFPYVVLGCLIGEALKYTSWTRIVYRFTSKHRVLALLSATVLGILSPLCTFGTVPVLIALYGGGVAAAPLIAFLSASSMMNPQLFVMTFGGLGWEMALLRLLCVFVFSLLCGVGTLFLPERIVIREKLRKDLAKEGAEKIESRPKKQFRFPEYMKAVGKNLWFVGRMMLLGIVIASFINLLPMSALFSEVDTKTPLGILIAAIAGIPIYACGGATIPMISSLMAEGLSRGSALAFLTVGPATRITSLAAITSVFKKRFLAIYVAVLLVFSVLAGLLFV